MGIRRKATRQGPPQKKKLLVEELEPRLLFSADWHGVFAQDAGPAADDTEEVFERLDLGTQDQLFVLRYNAPTVRAVSPVAIGSITAGRDPRS